MVHRPRLAGPCALALAAAALAGCGSSSSSSSGGASDAAAKVTTMKIGGYGTVLAASGRPLYLHDSDPSGASSCTGACAANWPPFTAQGTPAAGPGVQAHLLSTFKRSDGSRQVLYAKHALYRHRGRGLVSGAGVSSDGGTWYLVSPSGTAITTTASGGY